jgi:hypothetical protein
MSAEYILSCMRLCSNPLVNVPLDPEKKPDMLDNLSSCCSWTVGNRGKVMELSVSTL